VLGREGRQQPCSHRVDREQLRAQAGELRRRAQRGGVEPVQERAAGVGVDLDQARALGGQVEVVAHEDGVVGGAMARDRVGAGLRVGAALEGLGVGHPEQRRHGALDRLEAGALESDHAPRIGDGRRKCGGARGFGHGGNIEDDRCVSDARCPTFRAPWIPSACISGASSRSRRRAR
jgi:hypothetical protein